MQEASVPEHERLGFPDRKSWAEAFSQAAGWKKASEVVFYLEAGIPNEAKTTIQNLRALISGRAESVSGASGGDLLKLVGLGLIDEHREGELKVPAKEELQGIRKRVDQELGNFAQKDQSYLEWEYVGKILSGINRGATEVTNKRIADLRTAWDNGNSRAGSVLTKLQALNIIN